MATEEIADEVADECIKMTLYEDFCFGARIANGKSIWVYPATDESNLVLFEAWKRRQKNILIRTFL
jgi:hypothetical protein